MFLPPLDCDNSIQNGGLPATSGCDMLCNGNHSEICGGPSRLNVYDYHMLFPVSTSSSSTSQSSTSTSSSTGTSTSSSTSAHSTTTTGSSATSSSTHSTSSTVSSTTSSTSATATPTGPRQPKTVGDWTWYGCQTEATNMRALSGQDLYSRHHDA